MSIATFIEITQVRVNCKTRFLRTAISRWIARISTTCFVEPIKIILTCPCIHVGIDANTQTVCNAIAHRCCKTTKFVVPTLVVAAKIVVEKGSYEIEFTIFLFMT